MKLALTRDERIVILTADGMLDASGIFSDVRYRDSRDRMPKVLGLLHERRAALDELAANGAPEPLADLMAPVPRPPKLIAAFGNYREGRSGDRLTQDMFLKSPDSVIGPGETVALPNHPVEIFHHEAELALVIGKRAKDLPADESALDVLAGYTLGIDVSGRGIGRMGPSRMGKSFDTFTPLGPAIVTPDEVGDPQNLRVTLSVNGEARQDYNTSDMEYSVVEVLAFITSYMTLVPGDVLLTGTNHQGLGALQDGDQVVMTIEKVGTLEVNVRDPQGRSWPRGIDEAIAARVRGAR